MCVRGIHQKERGLKDGFAGGHVFMTNLLVSGRPANFACFLRRFLTSKISPTMIYSIDKKKLKEEQSDEGSVATKPPYIIQLAKKY